MIEEREDELTEPRDGIDAIDGFGFFAFGIEQRDALEDFALRIRQFDFGGHAPAPDAPQRLTADVIEPFDIDEIPTADRLPADGAQPSRDTAFRAITGERRPLARKPDDLALLTGFHSQARQRVEVQGSWRDGRG